MKKLLLIALIFCNYAFAGEIKFHPAIDSGFVSGQFTCTELNSYGQMTYACGGKDSDGSIRSVPAKSISTLSSTFFTPYHDPKKIKILSVYIHSFAGQIQNNGETMVNCLFADQQLTANSNFCIILTNSQCYVVPQCKKPFNQEK